VAAGTGGDGGSAATGRAGEDEALRLLEDRFAYRVVDTNVRFGARRSGLPGEIDIVAWDGATLCFVEVKTRRRAAPDGTPAENVTPAKQRQIARLALAYAARHGLLEESPGAEGDPVPLRFDVVAVTLSPPRARLIRGAFLAPEGFDE
jgi:putative endonuclease